MSLGQQFVDWCFTIPQGRIVFNAWNDTLKLGVVVNEVLWFTIQTLKYDGITWSLVTNGEYFNENEAVNASQEIFKMNTVPPKKRLELIDTITKSVWSIEDRILTVSCYNLQFDIVKLQRDNYRYYFQSDITRNPTSLPIRIQMYSQANGRINAQIRQMVEEDVWELVSMHTLERNFDTQ